MTIIACCCTRDVGCCKNIASHGAITHVGPLYLTVTQLDSYSGCNPGPMVSCVAGPPALPLDYPMNALAVTSDSSWTFGFGFTPPDTLWPFCNIQGFRVGCSTTFPHIVTSLTPFVAPPLTIYCYPLARFGFASSNEPFSPCLLTLVSCNPFYAAAEVDWLASRTCFGTEGDLIRMRIEVYE